MRRIQLWAPVVAYMAAIFWASSLPDAPLPTTISDLSAHSLAYVGLAILVVRALAGGLPRRIDVRVAMTASLITVAYGGTDEWHQMFVPGRSAELRDIIADATGAFVGTIACWAWGIISSASDPHRRPAR